VKAKNAVYDPKRSNFWATEAYKERKCCQWMMQAMNNDLLNGAQDQERDPNILRLAAEHGAWPDVIDRHGNTPLHLAIMACPAEAEARHEAAMLGLSVKSSLEPLGGTMTCELPLPGFAKKAIKKKIAAWATKLQRNADILDVLCRISLADPAIPNNEGKTCFDLAEDKFPYIMHQLQEQVVHLEHVAEQLAIVEEDEEYEPEPYVWKKDHTDIADTEGRASRAYINAQLDRGMFAKVTGEVQSSSMHTKGGTNDYTQQVEGRLL